MFRSKLISIFNKDRLKNLKKRKSFSCLALLLVFCMLLNIIPMQFISLPDMAYGAGSLQPPAGFEIVKDEDYLKGDENLGHDAGPTDAAPAVYEAVFSWQAASKSGLFENSALTYIVTILDDNNRTFTVLETSETTAVFDQLPSGNVYHAAIRSKETPRDDKGNLNENSAITSSEADPVYFATNLDFKVRNLGSGVMRIEWDRMKFRGKDISYTIYFTDGAGLQNGEDFARKNQNSGWYDRKIFSHLINVPGGYSITTDGKIYTDIPMGEGVLWYFKIVPQLNPDIITNDNVRVLVAGTKIILTATRISGELWRLNWNDVKTFDDSPVTYSVLRKRILERDNSGKITKLDNPERVADVPITQTYIAVADNVEYVYFVEVANIPTPFPDEIFGLVSDEVELIQTVPYKPQIPMIPYEELPDGTVTERILTQDTPVVQYEAAEIKYNSYKQIWLVPKFPGSTETDRNVYYDIWRVEDPSKLSTSAPTFANVKMSEANFIYFMRNGETVGNAIGYRYLFSDLKPNTVYYIQVVAKRKFNVFNEQTGQVEELIETSEPLSKTIVTPPIDNINQPEAISKPPLRVKINGMDSGVLDAEGKRLVRHMDDFEEFAQKNQAVTTTSVTLQWKNRWWEVLDNGNWYSMWFEKKNNGSTDWHYEGVYDKDDLPDFNSVTDGVLGLVPDGNHAPIRVNGLPLIKEINHQDARYTLKYAKYKQGDTISSFKDQDIKTVDPRNILTNSSNTVECIVNNLEPNTTYAFWVTVTRPQNNTVSFSSDLILATTKDNLVTGPETPAVPEIDKNHSEAQSTQARIYWTADTRYTYVIAYGTEDNVNKAAKINVNPALVERYGIYSIYTIEGLLPSTTYYFWLRAVSDPQHMSDFSNSILLRTSDLQPPGPPTGFGVKSTDDAIGKDYITFEWIAVPGLDYELEVSTEPEFLSPLKIKVTGVPKSNPIGETIEYKVEDLLSNCWYYARIFSYDPETKIRSEKPAPEIIDPDVWNKKHYYLKVKTMRSFDDYDSDVEKWEVITGDIVVSKEPSYDDRTWYMEIMGINADRFAQMIYTGNDIDYKLNMISPQSTYEPEKYNIKLSSKVAEALSQYRSNLVIEMKEAQVTIRPFVFQLKPAAFFGNPETVIEMNMSSGTSDGNFTGAGESLLSEVLYISAAARKGSDVRTVGEFNRPLKVTMKYSEYYGRSDENNTFVRVYNEQSGQRIDIASIFLQNSVSANASNGLVTAEVKQSGKVGVVLKRTNIIDESWQASKRQITREEGLKMIMDAIGYKYGDDYAAVGKKSGITKFINMASSDPGDMSRKLTREEFITMLAGTWELKTRNRFKAEGSSDYSRESFKFALEKGIIKEDDLFISPGINILKGDAQNMLKRFLDLGL